VSFFNCGNDNVFDGYSMGKGLIAVSVRIKRDIPTTRIS